MATTYINSYILAGGKILISSTPGPAATITTYSGYIVFQFTGSATLNVGSGSPSTADVFVLGGGSSGNAGSPNAGPFNPGGLGGNGGLRRESPAVAITANSPVPIVVGGTASNSSFGSVSSSGGTSGGSGGSSAGATGGNGPTNAYLTGSPANYGGGGGAGALLFGSGGSGGSSGGGNGGPGARPFPLGGPVNGTPGTPGLDNTGGGGGGGGSGAGFPVPGSGGSGGTGGSGVVIVRFPDADFRIS